MKKIDISEPRRMYWNDEADPLHGCPECKKELVNESQAYLLGIAKKEELLPFLITSKGGYFCSDCPVVVLNKEKFSMTAKTASGIDKPVFAVAGIIDNDAVPEDKRDIPYDDDNPIPLVEFLPRNVKESGEQDIQSQIEPVKKRKIGRNEPCSCGSGKKYKKCCM